MRHGAFDAIDLPVGHQIEVFVEQQSVDPFYWQSPFASLTDESEDSVGSSHLAYLLSGFSSVTYPAPLSHREALASLRRLPLRWY